MKLRTLGLVALAATLGLASCNKEEGPKVDNGPMSVSVTLENVVAATKSMQAAITAEEVALTDFQIFFADASGKFVQPYKSDGTTVSTQYFANMEAFTGRADDDKVFHFIESSVSQVIFVGNYASAISTKTYTTVDAIKELLDSKLVIGDQQEESVDGVAKLILWGKDDDLTKATAEQAEQDPNHPLYIAELYPAPRVSRIEIVGFSYDQVNTETPRNYTTMDIEQVVFDNYYPNATVVEGAVAGTKVYTQMDKSLIFGFLAGKKGLNPQEWYADDLTVSLTTDKYTLDYTSPVANHPSYNFFPNSEKISNDDHPKLAIKLTGKNTGEDDVPLYLYVDNFTTPVDATLAKVYKLNLAFDDNDLSNPFKCVAVTVDVVDWQVTTVTPVFGAK